jgi:uncharacterized protein YegP (UPF0339 family)
MTTKIIEFKNSRKLTFQIRRDGMNYFRWTLVSRNGSPICSSPDEGYRTLARCITAIHIVMKADIETEIEHDYVRKENKFNV